MDWIAKSLMNWTAAVVLVVPSSVALGGLGTWNGYAPKDLDRAGPHDFSVDPDLSDWHHLVIRASTKARCEQELSQKYYDYCYDRYQYFVCICLESAR